MSEPVQPSDTKESSAPATPSAAPAPAPTEQERLEQARQEERSKLRRQIADLEERAALAEGAAAKLKLVQEEAQTLKSQYEALRQALKPEGGLNVDTLIKEVAATSRQQAEAAFRSELDTQRAEFQRLEKEMKQSKLKAFRDSIVQAAGGRIVESLVVGESEAELQTSAEVAKAEFERIAQLARGDQKSPTPPPAPRDAGVTGGEPLAAAEQLQGLSPAEYARRRNEIRQKVLGARGLAGGHS